MSDLLAADVTCSAALGLAVRACGTGALAAEGAPGIAASGGSARLGESGAFALALAEFLDAGRGGAAAVATAAWDADETAGAAAETRPGAPAGREAGPPANERAWGSEGRAGAAGDRAWETETGSGEAETGSGEVGTGAGARRGARMDDVMLHLMGAAAASGVVSEHGAVAGGASPAVPVRAGAAARRAEGGVTAWSAAGVEARAAATAEVQAGAGMETRAGAAGEGRAVVTAAAPAGVLWEDGKALAEAMEAVPRAGGAVSARSEADTGVGAGTTGAGPAPSVAFRANGEAPASTTPASVPGGSWQGRGAVVTEQMVSVAPEALEHPAPEGPERPVGERVEHSVRERAEHSAPQAQEHPALWGRECAAAEGLERAAAAGWERVAAAGQERAAAEEPGSASAGRAGGAASPAADAASRAGEAAGPWSGAAAASLGAEAQAFAGLHADGAGPAGGPAGQEVHAVVDVERLFQRLVEEAHVRPTASGGTHLELRLVPEHLGRVHLDLVWQDDALSARFVVESPEARAALEQHLPRLEETLRDQGIAVASLGVEIGHAGQGGRRFAGERGYEEQSAATGRLRAAASAYAAGGGVRARYAVSASGRLDVLA